MIVIDRQMALQLGLAHYFTGTPCKHGHVDLRNTKSRVCAGCNRIGAAQHRQRYPDRVRAVNREQYLANIEQRKATQRQWNETNAERAARYAASYRDANPEVAPAWRRANKRRVVLYTTRRRTAKLKRTPAWADLTAIDAFYLNCPPGYEVDHIIPLRGKLVSGLHVLENLQYLSRRDNARKQAKFDPTAHCTFTNY